MAKTKISEFSATPANNTDIDSINLAEGCAPSGINDAIRELMSQLKDFQAGTAGDSFNGPVGATAATTGAFTTLAASGAVTLSGGTANGVPYLNGSKVLTSGSALVFDGTKLGIGSAPATTSGRSVDLDGVSLQPLYTMRASGLTSATTTWTLDNANSLVTFDSSSSWPFRWVINSSEQMRLTSTGLGIGTSSPAYKLDVNGVGRFGELASKILVGLNGDSISKDGDFYIQTSTANPLILRTNSTERARIDSSGNLLVGKTADTNSVAGTVITLVDAGGAGKHGKIKVTNTVGTGQYILEGLNASGGTVGGVITTSTATSFSTSSDYRLKENIAPMTGALYVVQQLKPCTYTWKSNGESTQGFIAHELQEFVPECVVGEKDAVDAEGNPKYQGIDTSFLVATLTAAIQELNAKFEAYKAAHP